MSKPSRPSLESVEDSSHFSTDDQALQDQQKQSPQLAQSETRAVRVLRVIVLLVLLAAAVTVSVLALLYVKRDEEEAFEQNFYDLSARLVDGFHSNARLNLQALDAFAMDATATAKATNQEWPLVVLDDFEARASVARAIVGSYFLGMYPYITNETRLEWEAFASNPINYAWVNASHEYQRSFADHHDRKVGDYAPDWSRNRRQLMKKMDYSQRDLQLDDKAFQVAINFDDDTVGYPPVKQEPEETQQPIDTTSAGAAQLEQADLTSPTTAQVQSSIPNPTTAQGQDDLPSPTISQAANDPSDNGFAQEEQEPQDEDFLMVEEDLTNSTNSTVWPESWNYSFPPQLLTYTPDGVPHNLYKWGGVELEEMGYEWIVDPQPGPYYSMWQLSPARENAAFDINYNLHQLAKDNSDSFASGFEVVRQKQKAIFSGVWNLDEDGVIAEDDDYDFRTVPASSVLYPIFNTVDYDEDRHVVALIEFDIEFGKLFASILPSNAQPLVCVVSSPCNQTISYLITGGSYEYLGAEDYHDLKYDHMRVEALLHDFELGLGTDGTYYNGVPVDTDFCPWKLEVYATEEMKVAYLTNNPYYVLVAMLGVFLFTSLTFLIYDLAVKRRQKVVHGRAVVADSLVGSLFPEQVAQQLYQEREEKHKLQRQKLDASTDDDDDSPIDIVNPSQSVVSSTKPIANYYQATTILFADLAGFTKWSAAHTPEDVFVMLETFYGAFDEIAKRRRVFKVETIGDCYVAVCGLPDPRREHATVMCRFARDCMNRMNALKEGELADKLGDDCRALQFRVGMHSGGVIAGVLRGEKGRFQLFGDTMNTASRMESNGVPGRIHVSQDTANELIALGKESWLEEREDRIVAKGKGEMTTYWVQISSAGSQRSGISGGHDSFISSSNTSE